jgi:hypothetical protein
MSYITFVAQRRRKSRTGAIMNEDGSGLDVTNSTFVGNAAYGGNGDDGEGVGGAIANSAAQTRISNSTLTNNSAFGAQSGVNYGGSGGGNLWKTTSPLGSASLINTIVANNTSGGNCRGPVADGGHNLSSEASCGFGATGFNNTDPLLDPAGLRSNGGPTQTIALLAGSVAVDTSDDCVVQNPGCLASPLSTDQRGTGFPRKSGAHVDIGAFELQAAAPPSCSRIVFMSFRDGNEEIYVMNADGTNQTRLTFNPAQDNFPALSPDGSKIVFASNRDGNEEVYVMNSDGTGQTRLTNSTADDASPSFSPDGSKITFHSFRDGNVEVYTMNVEGTSQTDITNNPASDSGPSWGACQANPTPTPTPTPTPPEVQRTKCCSRSPRSRRPLRRRRRNRIRGHHPARDSTHGGVACPRPSRSNK